MARRLINIKSGDKYRHYCSECGQLAGTTDLPVWPSRLAFCSKECSSAYFSLKRFGLMLACLVGYPLAVLGPWYALFTVGEAFDFGHIGWLAGIAAFFVAGATISFPIVRLLDRWTR